MYTAISLFSGLGGDTLGLKQAGCKVIAYNEFKPKFCESHQANFPDCELIKDGEIIDISKISDACFNKYKGHTDILFAGFPCQGFSNEGKKNPEDPRNSLVSKFLDIVEREQPRAWVFENVPGFQRSYGGRYFSAIIDRISKTEYKWVHCILNAADFGVPQHRERFFIIGARDFQPKRPLPTHAAEPDMLGLPLHVSLWDAISDLPTPIQGDRIGKFDYTSPPSNTYQQLMRQGSIQVTNHTAQKHSARVLDKISRVPAGGNMSSFIDVFAENAVHYCGGYRRAEKKPPSWTAYWTRGMTSIHPEQDRFLTPRECARIQSFPDKFEFKGATIENYTQICNAVPPLLANAVAVSLAKQLDSVKSIGKPRRNLSKIAYG
jgi:DNA (cytosine-5)-methyltransferase 1